MSRKQAIETITSKLAALDDEAVQDFADMLEHAGTESTLPRALTQRELPAIDQARQDFATGQTLTQDELERFLDAGLAERRKLRAAAS